MWKSNQSQHRRVDTHSLENRLATDHRLKLCCSLVSFHSWRHFYNYLQHWINGLLPFPHCSVHETAAPKPPGDYLLSQERITSAQTHKKLCLNEVFLTFSQWPKPNRRSLKDTSDSPVASKWISGDWKSPTAAKCILCVCATAALAKHHSTQSLPVQAFIQAKTSRIFPIYW